jgi:phosphatidylserine/phosphatidylglycerophosphate/cardiolipin synthase-like enzyme
MLFRVLGFLYLIVALVGVAAADPIRMTGTAEIFFSPKGGATEAVLRVLDSAKQEILIQAYSFTSKPIAKAILAAKKRGVAIEVILDKSNATAKYTAATFLSNAGISVLIDSNHA